MVGLGEWVLELEEGGNVDTLGTYGLNSVVSSGLGEVTKGPRMVAWVILRPGILDIVLWWPGGVVSVAGLSRLG